MRGRVLRVICVFAITLFAGSSLLAQTNAPSTNTTPPPSTNAPSTNTTPPPSTNAGATNTSPATTRPIMPPTPTNIPYTNFGVATVPIEGYRKVTLGATMDEVLAALAGDRLLLLPPHYFENPLALDPDNGETYISLEPNRYITSGRFLFKDNALYAILITYNKKQFSFLDILAALTRKYGPGKYVSAKKITWVAGGREIILERPNIVKYYDKDVGEKVLEDYRARKDNNAENRTELLDGL